MAVISWIGEAYGWGCRAVLSKQGLRWAVANLGDNINKAPWAIVAIITTTVSLVCESNIIKDFKDRSSLRVRRAYMIVAVMVIILAVMTSIFYFMPGNTLLSAFGTFNNSPLQRGLIPLAAILVDIFAIVFGYASGRFTSITDAYKAFVALPAKIIQFIIIMILAPQLIAECQYAFDDFFNDYTTAIWTLRILLYYMPLMMLILYHLRKKDI